MSANAQFDVAKTKTDRIRTIEDIGLISISNSILPLKIDRTIDEAENVSQFGQRFLSAFA